MIQNVTSQAFSIIGRAVLQSGGLGGGGAGGGESRVSVVLPSFDDDDEDDDATTVATNANLQLGARFSDNDVRSLDVESVPANRLGALQSTEVSSSSTTSAAPSTTTTTTTTTTTATVTTDKSESASNNEIDVKTTTDSLTLFTVRSFMVFFISYYLISVVNNTKII